MLPLMLFEYFTLYLAIICILCSPDLVDLTLLAFGNPWIDNQAGCFLFQLALQRSTGFLSNLYSLNFQYLAFLLNCCTKYLQRAKFQKSSRFDFKQHYFHSFIRTATYQPLSILTLSTSPTKPGLISPQY